MDGKFVLQIGKQGQDNDSNATDRLGSPADVAVDVSAKEVFAADGYANRRVVVFDSETGAYKRHWGAYGNRPSDDKQAKYDPAKPPSQQFGNPVHCVRLAKDGLLYVCDRANDRLQVFRPDGSFVKEAFYAKNTLAAGSVWDIAFSRDPQQKYIFLADGKNERVYVMDRQSLEILTSFGDGGRQPGQFFAVHSIATDSKGNIYTTETYEGKRVQKFAYKGIGAVPRTNQGVLWPRR
jgi:DNA-binding beta-propeller fold protein YncE